MSRILSLTKVILKNSTNIFGNFSSKKEGSRDKNKNKGAVLAIILLICFLVVGVSLFFTGYEILKIAKLSESGETIDVDWNFIENLLTVIAPYFFFFIFVFLNTLVASIFFLSNDNKIFLALPIKPHEIFLARFFSCLVTAYILELVFIVPLNVAYLTVLNPGFIVFINQILYFLFFPLIPISLTFFITIIIDKIIGIQKHREVFSLIYPLLSVIGIVLVELAMQSISPSDSPSNNVEVIAALKESIASLADSWGFLAPISKFLTYGYIFNNLSGLLYALCFSAISVAVVTLATLTAGAAYQKSMIGDNEKSRKSHKKSGEVLKTDVKKRSPITTYIQKEIRMIVRSPAALMQLIFPPIIFTAMFAVSIFSVYFTSDKMQEEFQQIILYVQNLMSFENGLMPFIVIGVTLILNTMIVASATAISREGKNAYLIKSIPLKASTQVRIKMIPGLFFSLLMLFILVIACTLGFSLPWYFPLIVAFPIILWSLVANYIMILIDLNKPYLEWENETASIKQNRSTIFSMLILFALVIVIAGLGVVVFLFSSLDSTLFLIILTVLAIILIVIMETYIKKHNNTLFKNFE